MEQIHRRFTVEQVKVLLKGYCESTLERSAVEETLGISKTRFFALLKRYRHDPDQFALTLSPAQGIPGSAPLLKPKLARS